MTDKLREQAEAILRDWEAQAGEMDFRNPTRAQIMQEAAVIRAALAAAPQPAVADQEALVEVIDNALRDWSNLPPLTCLRASYVADALLARGLRLPGQDALQQLADLGQQEDRAFETMAWAVQLPDGSLAQEWGNVTLWGSSVDAKSYARGECPEGGKPVRVAIRVVEGGDDAA